MTNVPLINRQINWSIINWILLKSYCFVLFDLFDPTIEVISSMIIQKFVTIKYFFQYKNLQKTLEYCSEKMTISCLRRESHVSNPICIIIKILTQGHPKWYVSVITKTSHFKNLWNNFCFCSHFVLIEWIYRRMCYWIWKICVIHVMLLVWKDILESKSADAKNAGHKHRPTLPLKW